MANGDQLEKLPKKMEKEYHADTILRRLDGINPGCFPRPLVLMADSKPSLSSGHSIPVTLPEKYRGELIARPGTDWMTREEFKEVYGKLGGILHARNPLGSNVDYEYFEGLAPKWQEKYMNLLGHHKISVVEDGMMYIVQMNAVPSDKTETTDGDVQVAVFEELTDIG